MTRSNRSGPCLNKMFAQFDLTLDRHHPMSSGRQLLLSGPPSGGVASTGGDTNE
jgi:hypothetical protein